MGTIAVQGAVGEFGEKATTVLTNFNFNSMAVINGYALGVNGDGLYLLNTGDQDDGQDYTREITFATTDFGLHNFKRVRFVYLGVETADPFTLSVSFDRGASSVDYSVTPKTSGMQYVRVPIGRGNQGRYITFKITSTKFIRLDSVEALLVVRPAGVNGY